ncbi:hypothetical protein WA158_005248 [Blastocystis sp. Blastoise]
MKTIFYILFVASFIGLIQAQCVAPQLEFQIIRTYAAYPSEESFKIVQGTSLDGTAIVEKTGVGYAGYTDVIPVCMSFNTVYTLGVKDSYGDGWSTGSKVSITYAGIVFYSSSGSTSSDPKATYIAKPFNTNVSVAPGSSWKYSNVAQSGTTWTQTTFGDASWVATAPGSFPSVTTTTRYYRLNVSVNDAAAFAIQVYVNTNSGFILYANGEEINRFALPAGVVGADIPSTVAEESATWKSVVIPKAIYGTTGQITLAIEVHASTSQLNSVDPFNGFITLLSSTDGVVVGQGGTGTCTPENTGNANENCAKLFDGSYSSKFLVDDVTAVTAVYSLPTGSKAWFNAYRITSGNDVPGRDPKVWKVWASEDNGATWILLDNKSGETFDSRKQTKVYYLLTNRKAFNKVKFEVLNNNGDSKVQVSEFEIVAYNKPILASGVHYPNAIESVNAFSDVNINPDSNGYTTFTITPALPSGLFLNADNGNIYGSTEAASSQAYTISAVGADNQPSSFQLTITVIGCSQPTQAQVTYRKVNKGTSTDERFIVYSETNTQLYAGQGVNNGADQLHGECQAAGRLKVVLFDDGNNGWEKGAYLDISIKYSATESIRVARLYLPSGTTDTFYVNTRLDLAAKTGLKYIVGQVPANWFATSFSDAAWQTTSYSPMTTATQNLALFRKTFTITSKTNMVGWELYFKAKAGSVVYVNGVEVYRYAISDGAVSTSSFATSGETSFIWRSVSGPMSSLNAGNSVTIAMAHLNIGSGSYDLDVDALFRLNADSKVALNPSGIASSDSIDMDGSASSAFDSNIGTRWITGLHDSKSPKFIQIMFSNKKAAYANKYCVINSWDAPQHDPLDWYISGSMDGQAWTLLSNQTNVSWEDRNQRQCFYISGLTQAWAGYRLTVTRAQLMDQNRYALLELEFYTIDLDTIVIPALSMAPSNLIAYKGISVPALLTSSEYYSDYTITPALPTGITMDTSNGYFNGVPTTLLTPTVYTITAKSIKGQTATTTVTFSVIACASPNQLFMLEFYFAGGAIEASWTLKDPSNQVVDSKNVAVSYTTQRFGYCKPAGVYTLVLGDTANDGWGDGYVRIIYEDEVLVLKTTVAYGESPKTVTANIGRLIAPGGTQWKYVYGSAPSGWNTVTFSDNTWQTALPGSFPAPTGTTQYYRATFTITSLDATLAGIEFGASSYGGIVMYLNGKEIHRVNMPTTGAINSETLATAETDAYVRYYLSQSLTTQSVITGLNVFAVEIHKKDKLPTTCGFEGSASFLGNNDYRVKEGTVWSDINNTGNEGVEKLFDNNIQTKVVNGPRCVGAIFQYTFSNGRKEFVNHYKVTNANDCNRRHPSTWRLEGSNDNGDTWTLLDYERNQFFSTFKQTFSYDFYSLEAYNSIRMVVLECNNPSIGYDSYCGDGHIQLSELGFYINNKPASCPAIDGFGAAPEGGFGFKACPAYFVGATRRACTNGVYADPQYLCELDAPRPLVYSAKSYVFYTGRDNATPQPRVRAAEYNITITPALPAGLSINTKTGIISGKPQTNFVEADYTITLANAKGSETAVITLSSIDAPGLGAGGVVLIVIAVIIIIIFVALIVTCIVLRRKKGKKGGHKQISAAKSNSNKKPTTGAKTVKV